MTNLDVNFVIPPQGNIHIECLAKELRDNILTFIMCCNLCYDIPKEIKLMIIRFALGRVVNSKDIDGKHTSSALKYFGLKLQKNDDVLAWWSSYILSQSAHTINKLVVHTHQPDAFLKMISEKKDIVYVIGELRLANTPKGCIFRIPPHGDVFLGVVSYGMIATQMIARVNAFARSDSIEFGNFKTVVIKNVDRHCASTKKMTKDLELWAPEPICLCRYSPWGSYSLKIHPKPDVSIIYGLYGILSPDARNKVMIGETTDS